MMPLTRKMIRLESIELYRAVMAKGIPDAIRTLCQEDLFFLLVVICRRKDINNQWLYERCREVEADPDGYLDLWAREHYKSTIITFGLTIQSILNDPEVTIGIFSHTRPLAKDFLEQIKLELENNTTLQDLFPDILYKSPKKEADSWSLDGGITVKRKSNPREATVEAWGLVDAQPTGKHFQIVIYDDVVVLASCNTPEMIAKTTEAFEMSLNLGDKRRGKYRGVGTPYRFNDTYNTISKRLTLVPRKHPATDNGKVDGKPVFLTQEQLDIARKDMGPYVFGSQMLLDPVSDKVMNFLEAWLRSYDRLERVSGWNIYILVDPASKKKKKSDFTAMLVLGLSPDGNYYLLDGVYDRLNLTERANKLFAFVRKWKPIKVGYEEYGLQADIEHMRYRMELENYRFEIVPLGGSMSKEDRILRLVPIFEQSRMWWPNRILFRNYEGKPQDLVNILRNDEYIPFPVCGHDDGMDCMSRILDPALGAKFPDSGELDFSRQEGPAKLTTDYDLFNKRNQGIRGQYRRAG